MAEPSGHSTATRAAEALNFSPASAEFNDLHGSPVCQFPKEVGIISFVLHWPTERPTASVALQYRVPIQSRQRSSRSAVGLEDMCLVCWVRRGNWTSACGISSAKPKRLS